MTKHGLSLLVFNTWLISKHLWNNTLDEVLMSISNLCYAEFRTLLKYSKVWQRYIWYLSTHFLQGSLGSLMVVMINMDAAFMGAYPHKNLLLKIKYVSIEVEKK